MTEAIAKAPTAGASLITTMANRYGLEPEKFMSTLKGTIFPTDKAATNEQVAAFLVVANEYDLNPFIKEIYAFPAKGGVTPIVSIDGWLTIINRQPALDGIEFDDKMGEDGKLLAVTARIYRKDRSKPTEVTEYMSECRRDTEPWRKWPARMLRHKALIQCGRYAFGLAGIVDPDEAERIQQAEDGAADQSEFVQQLAVRTAENQTDLRKRLEAPAAPIEPVADPEPEAIDVVIVESVPDEAPAPVLDAKESKRQDLIIAVKDAAIEKAEGDEDAYNELIKDIDFEKATQGQLKDRLREFQAT